MRLRLSVLLALALLAAAPVAASGAIRVAPNHVAHPRARTSSADDGGRQGLTAPTDLCPGQAEADAPTGAQLDAMRCLIDYARHQEGLAALADSDRLDRSAGAKAADILRCDEFSHYACGRPFDYWLQRVGYIPAPCWRIGENIAWQGGARTTTRDVFELLIHSPPHRANILGSYSQVGVGLRVGELEGHGAAHVWTQHFGTHC